MGGFIRRQMHGGPKTRVLNQWKESLVSARTRGPQAELHMASPRPSGSRSTRTRMIGWTVAAIVACSAWPQMWHHVRSCLWQFSFHLCWSLITWLAVQQVLVWPCLLQAALVHLSQQLSQLVSLQAMLFLSHSKVFWSWAWRTV